MTTQQVLKKIMDLGLLSLDGDFVVGVNGNKSDDNDVYQALLWASGNEAELNPPGQDSEGLDYASLFKALRQAVRIGHLRVGASGEFVYSHHDWFSCNQSPELVYALKTICYDLNVKNGSPYREEEVSE